jgi:hypothetical protein
MATMSPPVPNTASVSSGRVYAASHNNTQNSLPVPSEVTLKLSGVAAAEPAIHLRLLDTVEQPQQDVGMLNDVSAW